MTLNEKPAFLQKIIKKKRERLETLRPEISLEELREQAIHARTHSVSYRLRNALQNTSRTNIIAEFKRVSPSKGAIKPNADPANVARNYLAGGAAAISVLTEEDFFGGSLKDLKTVIASIDDKIPVLCKDFIIEESQVYRAALAGASAVLLIVAAFEEDEKLIRLRLIIEEELKMDALVEVHTAQEMQRAIGIGAKIIGINNRDLHTFEVSLDTSIELQKLAPAEVLLISESGLKTVSEIEFLRELGFDGFLIGETLMRAENEREALKEMTRTGQR